MVTLFEASARSRCGSATRMDPTVKRQALESIMPPKLCCRRFKVTDKRIASLEETLLCGAKSLQVTCERGLSQPDSA